MRSDASGGTVAGHHLGAFGGSASLRRAERGRFRGWPGRGCPGRTSPSPAAGDRVTGDRRMPTDRLRSRRRCRSDVRLAPSTIRRDHNNPAEGAFQDYTVLQANMASPMPASMPYENAAVLPLALSTAACALFEEGLPRACVPVAVGPADRGDRLGLGRVDQRGRQRHPAAGRGRLPGGHHLLAQELRLRQRPGRQPGVRLRVPFSEHDSGSVGCDLA